MTNLSDQQMAKFHEEVKRQMHGHLEPFMSWVKTRYDRFVVKDGPVLKTSDGRDCPLINTPLAIRAFIDECHGEEWASEALAASISLLAVVHADDSRFNFRF